MSRRSTLRLQILFKPLHRVLFIFRSLYFFAIGPVSGYSDLEGVHPPAFNLHEQTDLLLRTDGAREKRKDRLLFFSSPAFFSPALGSQPPGAHELSPFCLVRAHIHGTFTRPRPRFFPVSSSVVFFSPFFPRPPRSGKEGQREEKEGREKNEEKREPVVPSARDPAFQPNFMGERSSPPTDWAPGSGFFSFFGVRPGNKKEGLSSSLCFLDSPQLPSSTTHSAPPPCAAGPDGG